MIKIVEKRTEQQKSGRKWITIETKTAEITREQYERTTNTETIKFFRRFGGREQVEKSWNYLGYTPVKIISTSPDKENRVIYEYEIDND